MKKIFVVALGLAFAVGVSAFVSKSSTHEIKKPTTTLMWFDFSGTTLGDYNDLSKYSQDPTHANPCSGSGLRCEVYAPVIATGPNAGKPDLSDIRDETFRP